MIPLFYLLGTPRYQVQVDMISREILLPVLNKSLQEYGSLEIISPEGSLDIKRFNNLSVKFPLNRNIYSIRQGANDLCRLVEFICSELNHLSWNDFHYAQPNDYKGNEPSSLDDLCVYYRNLRQNPRVTMDEKRFVLRRFYDLMYIETESFARTLGMPFRKLTLNNFSRSKNNPSRAMASTDCFGTIHYNRFYLFFDADSIRQILVHELCHSTNRGHSKEFSKVYEESMLALGLITRPCAFSDHLCMPDTGARFPTGSYCPGFDFVKGIKGDYQNFLFDVKL